LFFMWFYYSTAVARDVFGAANETDPLYIKGVEFAGLTLSFYNVVAFIVALFIPVLAMRFGKKQTHALCLILGAVGLVSVGFVTHQNFLYVSMIGVGIAWASILSMPYAMLAGALPENKIGVYMGIFNFFIVLPEIIASLFFGWIMSHLLHNNRTLAVQIGGGFMLVAAVLCYLLVDDKD